MFEYWYGILQHKKEITFTRVNINFIICSTKIGEFVYKVEQERCMFYITENLHTFIVFDTHKYLHFILETLISTNTLLSLDITMIKR